MVTATQPRASVLVGHFRHLLGMVASGEAERDAAGWLSAFSELLQSDWEPDPIPEPQNVPVPPPAGNVVIAAQFNQLVALVTQQNAQIAALTAASEAQHLQLTAPPSSPGETAFPPSGAQVADGSA